MRHWRVGPGTRVGIVGFGGLGQMAVKLARALGATVTVVSTSPDKEGDAVRLGARDVILSTDEKAMKARESSLDFVLSTIPQPHDANPYVALVARDGVYAVVGCIAPLKAPLDLSKMIPDRKSLGTSLIGSIRETREVLDLCSKHGIVSEVKIIPIDEINDAFDAVDKGEVDFRYVIDMATIDGKTQDESLAAMVGL